jgi:hypothetical protein
VFFSRPSFFPAGFGSSSAFTTASPGEKVQGAASVVDDLQNRRSPNATTKTKNEHLSFQDLQLSVVEQAGKLVPKSPAHRRHASRAIAGCQANRPLYRASPAGVHAPFEYHSP